MQCTNLMFLGYIRLSILFKHKLKLAYLMFTSYYNISEIDSSYSHLAVYLMPTLKNIVTLIQTWLYILFQLNTISSILLQLLKIDHITTSKNRSYSGDPFLIGMPSTSDIKITFRSHNFLGLLESMKSDKRHSGFI